MVNNFQKIEFIRSIWLHWWILPNIKEEMIPSPYKHFQKIEAEITCFNLFYEARITLITNQIKNIAIKENLDKYHL